MHRRQIFNPASGLLALTLLVALVAGIPLLALLPAIALLGCLSFGRVPGEAAVLRLYARRQRRRVRAPRSLPASRARITAIAPRGTALLALRRAVRPPPRSLTYA